MTANIYCFFIYFCFFSFLLAWFSLTKGDCSTLVRMSLQSSTADGVSVGRLDVIKKQYSDLNDCSRETLKTWLRTCVPPPTWMNIVEMLRSRTVDAARLAAELERKYCSSRHDSPPPLPTQLTIPHLPPSDALQIEMTSQHPVQPAVAAGMYKGYLLLFAHPMLYVFWCHTAKLKLKHSLVHLLPNSLTTSRLIL